MSLLGWVIALIVAAIILAVLGFGVLAATAAVIAKILFYIAIAVFVIMLISMALKRAA